jgi:hypothetical protein
MFRAIINEEHLIKLAEDHRTLPGILHFLSHHESVSVRSAVADNPNTPSPIMFMLAHDESPDIRFQIAENHNVAQEILWILTKDENPHVQVRAERTLARLENSPKNHDANCNCVQNAFLCA